MFENLLVGARPWPAADASARGGRYLRRHPRAHRPHRRAPTVAAGALTLLERKRLELARALATEPRLLLLDEIAGGLTEGECHELVETIRGIHAAGITIVWIEHIVHALLAVVGRLIVLNFGTQDRRGRAARGDGLAGGARRSTWASRHDMALLETRALTAFYGDFQALFGIDIALDEGETVAIIGANGAGKSTYLEVDRRADPQQPATACCSTATPIGALPALR